MLVYFLFSDPNFIPLGQPHNFYFTIFPNLAHCAPKVREHMGWLKCSCTLIRYQGKIGLTVYLILYCFIKIVPEAAEEENQNEFVI